MNKYLTLAGLAIVVASIGCSPMPGNPAENYSPPTPQTFDSQIEKIKADPNMSEEAKAQAIRGIEMSKAMSQSGSAPAGRR